MDGDMEWDRDRGAEVPWCGQNRRRMRGFLQIPCKSRVKTVRLDALLGETVRGKLLIVLDLRSWGC